TRLAWAALTAKLRADARRGAHPEPRLSSIKIKPACDGTYTLYRDGDAVSSGLTLHQAQELAAVLRCLDPGV
ncbi:hypothetical protein ACFPYM_06910, partial [Methylobacterium hispanicum]